MENRRDMLVTLLARLARNSLELRGYRPQIDIARRNSRRSVELAKTLYQGGARDFLNVIDAQRSLLLAEDALVQSDRATETNLVALYKALGGG